MDDRVGPITLGKKLDEALKKERWVAFAERSFGPSTVYDLEYVDFQMESAYGFLKLWKSTFSIRQFPKRLLQEVPFSNSTKINTGALVMQGVPKMMLVED